MTTITATKDSSFEEYLKSADTLAQEVVNAWGQHLLAGNGNHLTAEFLDIFDKACLYQQVKGHTDFYRSRNALSEAAAQVEQAARLRFIKAYQPWVEKRCKPRSPTAENE